MEMLKYCGRPYDAHARKKWTPRSGVLLMCPTTSNIRFPASWWVRNDLPIITLDIIDFSSRLRTGANIEKAIDGWKQSEDFKAVMRTSNTLFLDLDRTSAQLLYGNSYSDTMTVLALVIYRPWSGKWIWDIIDIDGRIIDRAPSQPAMISRTHYGDMYLQV